MNKDHRKLLALGVLTSVALWLMAAGTTPATGADTETGQPHCGMISSTEFSDSFIGTPRTSDSATDAAEAALTNPLVPGEEPSGEAETVVAEEDSARVAITDAGGEVSHLVEVEQDANGDWHAETVDECVDGAFSTEQVTERAVNTQWYYGVWSNNANVNYRIDNNVSAGWHSAIQAGIENYSDRAAGNGPNFNYMGTVASTNDMDSCDNSTNIIYQDPNLPGALGATHKCYHVPAGTALRYILRMQITMRSDIPGAWYTGSGAPGNQWDLQSIVTHEAGHATGFKGHFANGSYKCPVPRTEATATMCEGDPGIQGTAWLRTLTDRDINTINDAY